MKRDGQRRADREEKERVLKVMKADMVDKVKDAGKAVDAADLDVVKLEKQVQPLTNKAKTMCAPSMILLADETDTLIGEAKATVMAARRHIESLSEGIEAPFKADLQSFLTTEAKQLELRIGRMDSRLSRATNLSVRFRESANKKVAAELERLRSNALKVIRYNQRVQKLTNEEVFGQFDANGDDAVSEEEFMEYFERADKTIKELDTTSMNKNDLLSFLQGDEATATDDFAVVKDGELAGGLEDAQDANDSQALPSDEAEAPVTSIKPTSDQDEVVDGQQQELKASEDGRGTGDVVEVVELSREEVKRLFAHLCGEQATTLSREAFLRIVRVYMKVVKETAMTGGVSIKGSKTLRRLEPSEVVEIIEGPVKEDTVDVMRVRARAMKDGLDGWITIAGNQGTVFLEDGGNVKAW
uniref:EF-hand domain-containing protein n=1 Tax=Noctiluca scintillans TaxID=2966 RepID=A0A7S1AK39_NOCSC